MLLLILYHAYGLHMSKSHGMAVDNYFVPLCQKNILSSVIIYMQFLLSTEKFYPDFNAYSFKILWGSGLGRCICVEIFNTPPPSPPPPHKPPARKEMVILSCVTTLSNCCRLFATSASSASTRQWRYEQQATYKPRRAKSPR